MKKEKIKLMKMKTFSILAPKLLNFLICITPLTFILGNFAINTQILITSIIGIIYYRKKIFDFFDKNLIILILLFFLSVFISTFIESLENSKNDHLIKSITW